MNNLRRLADRYKLRAAQLRNIAELDSCPETAQMLLEVAERYDEVAKTANAIERTYHTLAHDDGTEFSKKETSNHKESPYADAALFGHHHICAFFHSAEEEDKTLFPFIKDGLERGYKVRRHIDPNLRDDYARRLTQAGIEVAEAERDGQFEMQDWAKSYLRGGRFDKDRMLAWITESQQRLGEQSHERVLSIGHMEWALKDQRCLDDLVEYEARLNDILPKHVVGVCVYDLAKFSGDTIVDVIRTHPVVMMDGFLHENPYYVPPDVFLRKWRGRHRPAR